MDKKVVYKVHGQAATFITISAFVGGEVKSWAEPIDDVMDAESIAGAIDKCLKSLEGLERGEEDAASS